MGKSCILSLLVVVREDHFKLPESSRDVCLWIFFDGSDEQVPIIMGVLGNNAKTIIGEISKEGDEDSTFMPKVVMMMIVISADDN